MHFTGHSLSHLSQSGPMGYRESLCREGKQPVHNLTAPRGRKSTTDFLITKP